MKNKRIQSCAFSNSFDKKTSAAHTDSLCSNTLNEENTHLRSFDDNLQALSKDLSKHSDSYVVKEAEFMLLSDRYEISLHWCAHCGRDTLAETVLKPTHKTFWSAVGIFFSGGFLGCFLLPYISPSCQEKQTQCRQCKHYI